jgi:citrate synthase
MTTSSGYSNSYSKITPEINKLAEICTSISIDSELYTKYDVKRGLRDLKGKGVLTGLTRISERNATKTVNGVTEPADGELFYRGINVKDLIAGQPEDMHCGFEEATYLILFGKLPTAKELADFRTLLAHSRSRMPKNFFRDVIMQKPSADLMNNIARAVLNLYAYDTQPMDLSIPNVLRQSLELIAVFPQIAVHSYDAMQYYIDKDSLVVHRPRHDLSIAEYIL